MKKIIVFSIILTIIFFAAATMISGAMSIHFMTDYGFMWKKEVLEERLTLGPDLMETAGIFVDGWEIEKPELSSRGSGEIEFRWDAPQVANTLIIKEPKSTVMQFDVQVFRQGQWETVYSNDQIGRFRYVLLNDIETGAPLVTDSLKIRVLSADSFYGTSFKIEDAGLYNVTKEIRDDFLVSAYASAGESGDTPWRETAVGQALARETFDVVNDFMFFNSFNVEQDGHLIESSNFINAYNDVIERRQALQKDVSIRISIFPGSKYGGMDSSYYYESAFSTAEHRKNFIEDTRQALEKYPEIEGIDLDWETYFTPKTLGYYKEIIVELKEAFPEQRISLAAHTMPDNGLPAEAVKALSEINLMGYDNYNKHWYHADFETTAYGMINRAIAYGYEPDQIVFGHGFFGRPDIDSWDVPQWENHNQYNDRLGWFGNIIPKEGYDLYFNGPAMVADKTALAIDSGVKGVMIWHYTLTTDDENSLYKAIEFAMNTRGGSQK